MEKANSRGVMGDFMKGTILMIKNMDLEYINGKVYQIN